LGARRRESSRRTSARNILHETKLFDHRGGVRAVSDARARAIDRANVSRATCVCRPYDASCARHDNYDNDIDVNDDDHAAGRQLSHAP
jgi:hypothetical protein